MNPGEAGVIRDDINKYENTTISKVTGVLKDRVAEVYSRAKTGINKIGTAVGGVVDKIPGKRILLGGKPIPEKELLTIADTAFKSLFGYLEGDLNNLIEHNVKTVGAISGLAATIFSLIFFLYIAFFAIRYFFFARMDIVIYDFLLRCIKWSAIILIFFSIPFVTSMYQYFVNIDQALTAQLMGKSFGSGTMDTIATAAFRVIIPVYNKFAQAGVLTAPFEMLASMKLLLFFAIEITIFLSSCFTAYMGFKVLFAITLMFAPVAGGFLLFEETKNLFMSYALLLGSLLIGMITIVLLSDAFCDILSALLNKYYHGNILQDGVVDNLPSGILKEAGQNITDAAAFMSFGILEYFTLTTKVAAVVAVYVGLLLIVPTVSIRMFRGTIRSKRIG